MRSTRLKMLEERMTEKSRELAYFENWVIKLDKKIDGFDKKIKKLEVGSEK